MANNTSSGSKTSGNKSSSNKSSSNKSFTIGAFIVGALLVVFLALLFFSGGKLFSQKERVIMYFDGSVQGLQIGAPVKLKGVVLGEITDIQINFQSDDKPALTAVTADLRLQRINSKGANVNKEFLIDAIKHGLRAQLNYQSFLTGLLYVELDFRPDTKLQLYNFQESILELPTIATGFEEISQSLQEINVKGLVDNLEKLTADIGELVESGSVVETITSVKTAADSIDFAARSIAADAKTANEQLTLTTLELTKLLQSLNQQIPGISNNINTSLVELQKSLENINKTAESLNGTVAEDSPLMYQLQQTLKEVSRSANALRDFSTTLDEQPEALLRGRSIQDEE